MNFFKQKQFLGLFIILALAVAGFFIWQDLGYNKPEELPETAKNDSEVKVRKEGAGLEAGGDISGLIVEKIELQIPDLDRPVEIKTNIPEKIRQKIVLDIQNISSELKGNYNDLNNWLQLGILRKQIGDYEGAIEAWNFGSAIRPNTATPLLNMADLYAYYLKDRSKAEKSFLDAVKAEPQNGFTYFQTAGFYRDILQDTAKTKEILEQGISTGADYTGDLKLFLDAL